MKFSDIAYPWAESKQNTKKLRMKSNRPFMYMHHPKNWEMVHIETIEDKKKKRKPVLLPLFSIMRVEAGINNCRASGNGVQTSIAIANAQERGFTIIHPDKHDYVKVYPAINGNYYSDVFTDFEQYGSSLLTNFDNDSFNKFRANLVRSGEILLPHIHFIRVLQQENNKLITKYSQLQHNPNHEALYKKALQVDKDLKEAIEGIKKEGVEYYQ